MSEEENFLAALTKLRDEESKRKAKRKFNQTIDLLVNLKEFDVRKQAFNIFVEIPHQFKDKKIGGFFEKSSKVIETIKKDDFIKYKAKKDVKQLVKAYDSFVANTKLMPAVATSFGRVLGPVGKMPSPQLGTLPNEDDETVKKMVDKVNHSIRVIVKEASIKIGAARENLSNEKVVDNLVSVYHKVLSSLPKGKDNVRNVKIKFTMSKPVEVKL